MTPDRPTNRDLAERARQLADEHPAGSLARRGAACAAVCLHTTDTVNAARRALDLIRQHDVRAEAARAWEPLASAHKANHREWT